MPTSQNGHSQRYSYAFLFLSTACNGLLGHCCIAFLHHHTHHDRCLSFPAHSTGWLAWGKLPCRSKIWRLLEISRNMNLAVFSFSIGWSSVSVHIVSIACSWTAVVAIPVSSCLMYITLIHWNVWICCTDFIMSLSVLCLIIQWNCHIIFLNLSISSLDVQFLWSVLLSER